MENIVDEIIDQYTYADETNRPWIIGFSGGKDSTVMLQLVWKAISQIKELTGIVKRDIYVICNDTMVENPVITEYVYRVLKKIEQAAVEQDIPIKVIKTIPRLEDSFWVNLIGRGYPAPNNAFRWCTERLKIKPTSRFLVEQLDEFGEAIILIGTRTSESAQRAKSMKKHAIKGKRLTKHPTQPNTFMNMDSTPTENGYRGMRYILLIDEEHVIFKEKKYQDILEKILREIRSKGVSVIMLSQGIDEFNQSNFDFSSMCEISFLLDIKDKTNTKAINKFPGLSDKDGIKAARSLEKIQKGQAISNIKEFTKGELFELKQFYAG